MPETGQSHDTLLRSGRGERAGVTKAETSPAPEYVPATGPGPARLTGADPAANRDCPTEPAGNAHGDGRAAGGSLVLVGLMGSGKSTIGRRLANRLGMRFVDADDEIEKAAGCSISDIFATMGEAAFRDGERRVIARLLGEGPLVLATGGGAFMDESTRDRIRASGTSIWLRADLDVLVRRCQRRTHRPLLQQGNPRDVLRDLMARRHPLYETADVTVDSGDEDHETVVDRIVAALEQGGPAPGMAGQADARGPDADRPDCDGRPGGGRAGGTEHAG